MSTFQKIVREENNALAERIAEMVQAAVQTALSAQLQQAPAPAPKIPANGKTKIELPTGTVSNAVRAHLQDMDQNVLDFTWGKMDKADKGVFVAAVRNHISARGHLTGEAASITDKQLSSSIGETLRTMRCRANKMSAEETRRIERKRQKYNTQNDRLRRKVVANAALYKLVEKGDKKFYEKVLRCKKIRLDWESFPSPPPSDDEAAKEEARFKQQEALYIGGLLMREKHGKPLTAEEQKRLEDARKPTMPLEEVKEYMKMCGIVVEAAAVEDDE